MIATLARLLGLSDIAAKAAAGAAFVALLAVAYSLHEWRAGAALSMARTEGASAERRLWEAAAAKERERRDRVAAEADERGARDAAKLATERDDLARRLEDVDHEALLDPDRDRLGLPAGSVQRLDALR